MFQYPIFDVLSVIVAVIIAALIIRPHFLARVHQKTPAINYVDKEGSFGDVVEIPRHGPIDPFVLEQ